MPHTKTRRERLTAAIVRTYKLTWRDNDCDRDIELHERIDRLVRALDEIDRKGTEQ